MPLRRAVSGHPARRNVEGQELPNAPEVQPQGEVTNVEFREAIRMLSQVVTNQAGQQRGARQEEADTSRIREFLRMNPPSFTGSSTAKDSENFIEKLKKVFDVMHVTDTMRVELAAYQMKNVAKTWFDQWKVGRAEDAPPASWARFEKACLWHFFHRELKEAKVTDLDVEEVNKRLCKSCGWKKRSIFWDLPYWSSNMIRHNLDVMHIEKNVFDNVFSTVLNVDGKTKNDPKARQDVAKYCDWSQLARNPDGSYPKAA
ncbi:hypothetical protein MTR67_045015 [Solanum verrucosum]|uniref:Gag-pol polyprotein n=1 Tax=Solanum verrucosum TaxID=315347 RepID=A0AAF0UT88_SOLVR|nr:hypothetical protein MTR67_045015 [Solanum verrucosum]